VCAAPLIYSLPTGAFHDITHIPGAVVRADYANSENGNAGILYYVRTFDKQFTLATTAGYDDVTGRGTPNDPSGGLPCFAAHSRHIGSLFPRASVRASVEAWRGVPRHRT
jgi:hypothetical protein